MENKKPTKGIAIIGAIILGVVAIIVLVLSIIKSTQVAPGAIRITEDLKNKLEGAGFEFSEPIECKIKGKGMMRTFEVVQ